LIGEYDFMAYKIVRSQRKTLAIHVRYPNVEVRAPLAVSERQIHRFIQEKSAWIESKLLIQSHKHGERYQISENNVIPFMGKTKRIHCSKATRNQVTANEDCITIQGPNLNAAKRRSLFEAWLKTQAQAELTTRTHALTHRLGIGNRLKGIKYRKTKSKWGHCTSQGIVQYNWLVLMAPEHVIDYLVTHEVCHLVHLDHSKQFWQLVADIQPAYHESKQWLKEHGHRLWLD
jgi:predicted metal-dependent hydrolase